MSGFFRRIYDWLLRMFWYATFFLHSFPPSLVLYSLLLAARSCGPQKRQIAEQAEQNRAATSKRVSSGTWRHRPIFYQREGKKSYNNDYEG